MLRPLRKVTDIWPRAASVLVTRRIRMNTKSLAAVRVPRPVLSDVWWPMQVTGDERSEKLLTLWFNSTLGILSLLVHREDTEGAWLQFKKPLLHGMPILDVTALTAAQVDALVDAYDRLCQRPLLPFPQMAQDPVRMAIDEAIAQALGLPDYSILRELLAREPIVCLRPLA